jgi:hypothetical protein
MSARELVKRARLWSSSRPNGHAVEPLPPADAVEPAPADPVGEWNLWELERRARAYAGANAVREEWAATFRHLRQFAKSDGRLPPQFDSLVRESFPELTHPG